jgi:hypothetical protein
MRLEMKILMALSSRCMDANELADELCVIPHRVGPALKYLKRIGILTVDEGGKWMPMDHD